MLGRGRSLGDLARRVRLGEGVSDEGTGEEGKPSRLKRAREAGTEAATEAASRALQASTGIPATLSKPFLRFGIRKVWKIAAALLAAFLLLIGLLFASFAGLIGALGSFGIGAADPTATVAAQIPPGYLSAYEEAAQQYHVPWTVLAGLGEVLTHQGRTAPSDVVDYGELLDRAPALGSSVAGLAAAGAGGSGAVASLGGSGGSGEGVVAAAEQFLGVPYVWGGATPQGFDCSGLVQYVYRELGYNLPRTSEEQYAVGTPVASVAQAQPGDLLFYAGTDGTPTSPGHVAIFVGNGQMIQAPQTGEVVSFAPVGLPVGIRRIIGGVPGSATGPAVPGTPIAGAGSTAALASAVTLGATSPTYSAYDCRNGICGPSPVMGKSPSEPQGPLQLLPSVVKAANINGNDVQSAVDLVASQAASIRDQLVADSPDLYANWKTSNSEADALWTAVVNRLNNVIAAGQGASAQSCTNIQPGTPVDAMIQLIWSCEIQKAGTLHVVDSESVSGGHASFTQYPQATAATTLVSEALQVSYGYSKWGTTRCDSAAATAGVFPLTAAIATSYGDTNRCDLAANIDAAAKAVLAVETLPPALRPSSSGPYEPMLGGWVNVPAAFGSELATLLSSGPFQAWSPAAACNDAIDVWLNATAGRPDSPFSTVAASNVAQRLGALEAYLASVPGSPRQDPACLEPGGAVPPALAWAEAVSEQAAGLASTVGSLSPPGSAVDTSGTSGGSGSTNVASLEGLSTYWAAETSKLEGTTTSTWGVTSAISRLSTSGAGISYPTVDPTTPMPGLSIGAQVVEAAIAYGGDHPGDTRHGSIGAVLTTATAASMVQVALQPASASSTWSIPQLVAFGSCGSPSNTAYSGSEALVTTFGQLCQAAMLNGTSLAISTAARTNAEEVAAYAANPSVEFRPATNVGGSWQGNDPFEEGTAVRLVATPATTAWLSSIMGCYSAKTNQYSPFATPESPASYVSGAAVTCQSDQVPVKRAQTYGLVPDCAGPGEAATTTAAITCTGLMSNGLERQPDLLLLGQLVSANGPGQGGPLSQAVLMGILQETGWPSNEITNAVGVIDAESGGNPAEVAWGSGSTVLGDSLSATPPANIAGKYDEAAVGLFQDLLSPVSVITPQSVAQLQNPIENATVALGKFQSDMQAGVSGWSPWTGDAYVTAHNLLSDPNSFSGSATPPGTAVSG